MMMLEPLAFEGLRGTLTARAPLARHTSWRVGGPADLLYVPADRDDLASFVRQSRGQGAPTLIGLGSNLLVRDGGVRGAVVVMHDPGAALAVADGLLYVDAGVACPKLARFAALHGCAQAEFLDADVNASLRRFIDEGRSFDAIVLDPPKFAPTVAHAERAARAYKDINRLALKLLAPGGVLLTFSCSGGISADLFHKIVASAGIDAGVDGYISERLGAAPDHPMTIEFPEGEYLKGLVVLKR